MYPQPKKDAVGWMVTVFVGVAVLVLAGTIVFGVIVTKGDAGFGGLVGKNSDRSLGLKR